MQAETAFASDFAGGRIAGPYVAGGVLVCPGGLSESGFSHRCRFVSIDDQWCFDHPGAVFDEVRWSAGRPGERRGRRAMRSVTLVDVDEGAVIDAVRARIEGGTHRLVEAVRFEVVEGALVSAGRRRPGESFRWPEGRERGGGLGRVELLARTDRLLHTIDELAGRSERRRSRPARSRRVR